MSTVENSFRQAFERVIKGETLQVKNEVKEILGLKCDTAFYNRMRGDIEHTPAERAAIEGVFKNHGITENIWGD